MESNQFAVEPISLRKPKLTRSKVADIKPVRVLANDAIKTHSLEATTDGALAHLGQNREPEVRSAFISAIRPSSSLMAEAQPLTCSSPGLRQLARPDEISPSTEILAQTEHMPLRTIWIFRCNATDTRFDPSSLGQVSLRLIRLEQDVPTVT